MSFDQSSIYTLTLPRRDYSLTFVQWDNMASEFCGMIREGAISGMAADMGESMDSEVVVEFQETVNKRAFLAAVQSFRYPNR